MTHHFIIWRLENRANAETGFFPKNHYLRTFHKKHECIYHFITYGMMFNLLNPLFLFDVV